MNKKLLNMIGGSVLAALLLSGCATTKQEPPPPTTNDNVNQPGVNDRNDNITPGTKDHNGVNNQDNMNKKR
ncbi:hypothetical protein [Cytobacillus depressus]|nr:hypothetical protein [Cytobacillus depressus]